MGSKLLINCCLDAFSQNDVLKLQEHQFTFCRKVGAILAGKSGGQKFHLMKFQKIFENIFFYHSMPAHIHV